MFFKMLKNDLKRKKGLNLILLLFITAASVLLFVSAAQLYMQITGNERTAVHCNSSDALILITNGSGEQETTRKGVERVLDNTAGITGFVRDEGVILRAAQLDFDEVEEAEQESFFEKTQLVTTLPRTQNLVYDLNDQPFYVRNGTVALPHTMQSITGAKIGDKMRIISPMGRIYEFEIAQFYKEPSASFLFRYILSDADYAVLAEDAPLLTDIYAVMIKNGNVEPLDQALTALRTKGIVPMEHPLWAVMLGYGMNDNYVLNYVLTVFIMLVSVFMLIIILMTIRFTMISALSEEEKEIGMMRAMGIDSVSFRWLFAAKYIAFAVIGGIVGILAGYPLSRIVSKLFAGGITLPQPWEMILVGAASTVLMMLAIIGFSMLVMRRIKRISVMDAIHGENRGERFGKSSRLLLHRRGKMPVPVYLGLSDILTRFKRYVFLLIASTLGASMILLTGYLYDSVVCLDFAKYAIIYRADFFPDFNDDMMKAYEERENAEGKTFWEVFNEELDENGIAAHVHLNSYTNGELLTGGTTDCSVFFNYEEPEMLQFCEGQAPVLGNEAAMSSYTARQRGIRVGDEVDVSVLEYAESRLSSSMVRQKVIITGLIDMMEAGTPTLIMGKEYDRGVELDTTYYALTIDSEDKQAEFDKMVDLFHGHMMTTEEYVHRTMETYDLPLRLLRDVVTGTVIFVTILLTILYMNIFISEDTPEIALLRCMGFSEKNVRTAQLVRMLTLTVFSAAASILLLKTVGTVFVDVLFRVVGLSGFRFLPMPELTCCIMPVILLVSVLVPSLIRLHGIRSIKIANLSEE